MLDGQEFLFAAKLFIKKEWSCLSVFRLMVIPRRQLPWDKWWERNQT